MITAIFVVVTLLGILGIAAAIGLYVGYLR
jgi:hypothetical protein